MRYITAPIVMLLFLSQAGLAQSLSPKSAFNNHCRTCHSMKAGDHRLGPSLADIMGKQAGTAAGYSYSSAFENAGFIWDAGRMDAFLARPDQMVPGNNMNPYRGLTDANIRAAIITAIGG